MSKHNQNKFNARKGRKQDVKQLLYKNKKLERLYVDHETLTYMKLHRGEQSPREIGKISFDDATHAPIFTPHIIRLSSREVYNG